MDIVTWCNVPRYLHNDLPLGNPLGAPYDMEAQRQSIETALNLVETMNEPGVHVSNLHFEDLLCRLCMLVGRFCSYW